MRLSGRRLLVALIVVVAAVTAAAEYAEVTATSQYVLAARVPDSDGYLAEVRSAAPHGGIVAMSRDEDVLSAGWRYCVKHAETSPGEPTIISVAGRPLVDDDEIRLVARAALSSLCT